MSAEYAVPSSSSLERDAHEASSDHTVAPGEIAIGVVIGRAAEYFDFFVFGIASVLIFPGVFFPFSDPLTGTLYAFAIFALAFGQELQHPPKLATQVRRDRDIAAFDEARDPVERPNALVCVINPFKRLETEGALLSEIEEITA